MIDKTGRLIAKYNRIRRFAYLSVYWNAALAAYKIIFGLVTLSFFLCVNGLYNVAMGTMKYTAVYAYQKYDDRPGSDRYVAARRKQNDYYRLIGFLLIVASALYIVYCVRLFLGAPSTEYGAVVAIAVTAFTFAEIVLSLHGAILTRRDREPMMEAIKLINLASSMISLVLTQTALLSFTKGDNASFFNGLSGILFGSVAAGIGIYMIVHMRRLARGQTQRYYKKKIARMLAALVPEAGIDLIVFEDIEAHRPRLLCRYADYDPILFANAAIETDRRFGFELCFAEPRKNLSRESAFLPSYECYHAHPREKSKSRR